MKPGDHVPALRRGGFWAAPWLVQPTSPLNGRNGGGAAGANRPKSRLAPGRALLRRALLAALLLICGSGRSGRAETPKKDDGPPDLLELIAGNLVVLSRHVIWPPERLPAGEPIRIGIFGIDPFGEVLERILSNVTTEGRKLTAVRSDQPAALTQCQIIYCHNLSQRRLDDLLALTSGKPILTVIFSEDRVARGGTVELYVPRGRVEHFLNEREFKRSRLTPSPELGMNSLRTRPR